MPNNRAPATPNRRGPPAANRRPAVNHARHSDSSCCCACVDQGTVKVIERFGQFNRIAYPGFNCVCCLLGDFIAGTMNMRIRQLDVSAETKTQDNVFVHLVVSVQYQVHFVGGANRRRKYVVEYSYVFDVVRSSVPKLNLDDVFVSKEDIAGDIKEQLTKSMGSFGFTIIQTLVTDIVPNEKVKKAMNDINEATRLRAAAVEKAEAQKITVVKNAEADAEAKYLAGQGIARQRQAIIAGLRDSVVKFHESVPDIGNRDVMSMVMMTQYFDCLKDVGLHSKNGTIFLPHSPGNVREIADQIRDGALQAQAMSRSSG